MVELVSGIFPEYDRSRIKVSGDVLIWKELNQFSGEAFSKIAQSCMTGDMPGLFVSPDEERQFVFNSTRVVNSTLNGLDEEQRRKAETVVRGTLWHGRSPLVKLGGYTLVSPVNGDESNSVFLTTSAKEVVDRSRAGGYYERPGKIPVRGDEPLYQTEVDFWQAEAKKWYKMLGQKQPDYLKISLYQLQNLGSLTGRMFLGSIELNRGHSGDFKMAVYTDCLIAKAGISPKNEEVKVKAVPYLQGLKEEQVAEFFNKKLFPNAMERVVKLNQITRGDILRGLTDVAGLALGF